MIELVCSLEDEADQLSGDQGLVQFGVGLRDAVSKFTAMDLLYARTDRTISKLVIQEVSHLQTHELRKPGRP
jgi:hypothetical protein